MDRQKFKYLFFKNELLIIILIIALLFRIAFTFISPIPYWDEAVYANLGHDLSKSPFDYSFSHGWSDCTPGDISGKAGFRPPLLPYILSIFYFLNLDKLIKFIIPIIGALTVVTIYLLGNKLFNKRIGLYSAALFALIPVHVLYSSKILNDVLATFLISLSILFFYKGYEENSNKYKMLFGFVLAIALLSRYTVLWIMPLFPIYLLIRDKSFNFLKDKNLWKSILVFLITLIPLFLYGIFAYSNPIGALIHGFNASGYWGGAQSWYFFFQYGWYILSIVSILFVISLIYILQSRKYKHNQIYLLLIWFFLFFIMISIIPHKEDRFIIPAVPVICLISGFFIDKVGKYGKIIFIACIFILLFSNYLILKNNISSNYNINSQCFVETMSQLKDIDGDYVTVSENTALIYYYTHKESAFYPDKLNEETIANFTNAQNKQVFYIFTRHDSGFETQKWKDLKKVLSENYELYYSCPLDPEVNFIYKA